MRRKKNLILAIALGLTCSACSEKEEYNNGEATLSTNLEGKCLVVNMGNYSESNGSICVFEHGKSVAQNIFSRTNGFPLRSIVESATIGNGMVLLMCGNEDKVEILDEKNYRQLCPSITGIGLPRYATIIGNYAYVTCVNPSWTDTIGYITKINLTSKTPENRIKVQGNPEGITRKGDQIFVASKNGVYQIDSNRDEIKRFIALPHNDQTATARYFVEDADGDLWLSYAHYDALGYGSDCGIAELTPGDSIFKQTITLPMMNADGYIDVSPDKNTLYYLYASEIVGGQNPEAQTNIYSVDLSSKTVALKPTCSGVGFYGFNVDPSTGNIYTANVNGFITNSMVSIFNPKGELLQDGIMTGVGTCRFLFTK